MEDAFTRLQLDEYPGDDEFERPVFRSATMGPSGDELAWEAYDPEGPLGNKQKEQPKTRGLNADAGFAWDFQDVADLVTEAPPPRLVVNLVPHRIEADDEWLVHSLRQFTVTIELINGGSGVKIPSWASQGIDALRATLVYADTGEAVLPHKGEPPLVGEINPRRPHDGDNHMRLRVAALSYYHARRPFAVRIDADVAPGAPPGLFALSHPVRSVARLPAETKPATKPPSSATPSSAQSPYAVAGPTMAAHAAASRAAPALQPPDRSCHPQMAVVAVLDGDDNDERCVRAYSHSPQRRRAADADAVRLLERRHLARHRKYVDVRVHDGQVWRLPSPRHGRRLRHRLCCPIRRLCPPARLAR